MSAPLQDLLKRIPKVDRAMLWPQMAVLLTRHPRPEVVKAVRLSLENIRERLRSGRCTALPEQEEIITAVTAELARRGASSLRRVINASGVVIHTNLGRSPLADEAEAAIHTVSQGYSNLEYDLESGERGRRNSHVEGLICELTGAEAALVVNNNAAAVILALTALAAGREVIISRGELVEIGGSFRIPDVMAQSGAILVEVGTTNRTHIRDFQAAANDATALLLKVHTSNFSITGFTAEATVAEMAALGKESGLPVMLDAGSGCLIDLSPFGICCETTIRSYLEQGAGLVTFSADKLLGGPQAGIIAGRRDLVEPMQRHPLLRALRSDKLCLAALEATLRLYRDEKYALRDIPTLRMLTMSRDQSAQRAARIMRSLRRILPEAVQLIKHQGESSAGGGALPLLQLPTTLVEIRIIGSSAQDLEAALRRSATPVIGRIQRERFLLDVRTILDSDIPMLIDSLREATASLARNSQ